MAQTTWKQVVLDTADAIREANGTFDKIPVGQIAEKVRTGAGIPYTGDNPLTLGANGYNFPAKTLLKDGLQIINGVNGEDLTDTAEAQTTAVEELMKMVNRKVADHKGEGEFVWKKYVFNGYKCENPSFTLSGSNGIFYTGECKGDFINCVVADTEDAYPNGGELDGYWYELVNTVNVATELGYTSFAVDKFTPAERKGTYDVLPHTLGKVPKLAILMAEKAPTFTYYDYVSSAIGVMGHVLDYTIMEWTTLGSRGHSSANSYQTSGLFDYWTEDYVKFHYSDKNRYYEAGIEYTLVTFA